MSHRQSLIIWFLWLVIPASVILACIVWIRHQIDLRREALARLEEIDQTTKALLIKDVESLIVRLGRAPKDQEELESLLGRPLPCIHDGDFPKQIDYYKTGERSYRLHYELWATDDWTYDSTKPEAGWVQSFY